MTTADNTSEHKTALSRLARSEAVVVALTSALDARDDYAGRHSAETSSLARLIGERLRIGERELELVSQVAVLHDVGKLGIPRDVLLKQGPLDREEQALIREHPVIGERILCGIPGLSEVAAAIRHEHERWDGDGYPDGLAGEQIPLVSRIVFACDAWHAMTSDRPYRPAMTRSEALGELRAGAGTQFDPRIAQALLELLGEQAPSESPSESRDRRLSRPQDTVVDVSPAKRLADELEVLAAVREVTTVNADSMTDTLSAIAARARASLSAEFAAVATTPSASVDWAIGCSAGDWEPYDRDAPARALARFAARAGELPMLCQDVTEMPDAPEGFHHEDGVSSMHVLPIGSPAVAVMMVIHADPGLRGFTALCQRVASEMSDAAELVVRRALAQQRLREENARLAEKVRTDALTGVASRSAWDEAIRGEELRNGHGRGPMSVVIVDVDGLKTVNDEAGHAAGDELLRRCARVLAGCVRLTDLVARIGGDEFGVLLRHTDARQAQEWCTRLDLELIATGDQSLSCSLGWASSSSPGTVAATVDEADRRMYERKLERRVARG
jgi:diguanylate cyclase (GGDEF)-like protein